MTPALRYLSLGAGVQSTTLALMIEHGEVPAVDCAIFADTGWEPRAVYEHLTWLEGVLSYPVHRVTAGNLRQHVLDGAKLKPRLVEKVVRPVASEYVALVRGEDGTIVDVLDVTVSGPEETVTVEEVPRDIYRGIPAYTRQVDGSFGMLRRQCTREYKITPILGKVRDLLGLTARQRVPKDVIVEQLTGISADEADRAKPAQEPWLRRLYPLLDLRITRAGCLAWLRAHGYPQPPRSACLGCPLHTIGEWERIRRDPESWADVVEVDEAIRGGLVGGIKAPEVYLHARGKPLTETVRDTSGQGELALDENDRGGWPNECEGMCGV